MSLSIHSVVEPQKINPHINYSFPQVHYIVALCGTADDARVFETLYEVYVDQSHHPESLPDSAVNHEAARRLGIRFDAFRQQFNRMQKRLQQNAPYLLVN